jgi:hypothetical protein
MRRPSSAARRILHQVLRFGVARRGGGRQQHHDEAVRWPKALTLCAIICRSIGRARAVAESIYAVSARFRLCSTIDLARPAEMRLVGVPIRDLGREIRNSEIYYGWKN